MTYSVTFYVKYTYNKSWYSFTFLLVKVIILCSLTALYKGHYEDSSNLDIEFNSEIVDINGKDIYFVDGYYKVDGEYIAKNNIKIGDRIVKVNNLKE